VAINYKRSALLLIGHSVNLSRRIKKAVLGPEPRSPAAIANDITILNEDDAAVSSESVGWLLKGIFREPDLYAYAESKLSPQLVKARTFSEARQIVYKYFMSKSSGETKSLTDLDLRATQAVLAHEADTRKNQRAYDYDIMHKAGSGFWPNPIDVKNGRSLYTEFPYRLQRKLITKKTPLTSAGSCFAMEIAHRLQQDGYNYIVTEPNFRGRLLTPADSGQMSDSSAAWGIIFNTPSFRQLVERAFGLRELPRILWSRKGTYMDPFREYISFKSIEEYAATYDQHIAAAREALMRAEVMIITLGLNEIWRFKMDGAVFSRSPWRMAPSLVEQRVLTVQENVADLQAMLDTLRHFNPKLQLIVTLSPIPLHATFLHEAYHVVEANAHSKAVLRVAAQEFVEKNEGVYYFPSYELVTCGKEDAWLPDQRHVTPATVDRVMQMFDEIFVEG
jgi:hypothetical protein